MKRKKHVEKYLSDLVYVLNLQDWEISVEYVDEDQIINKDWNAVIEDMKDTVNNRHDPDEPSFLERVEQAGV